MPIQAGTYACERAYRPDVLAPLQACLRAFMGLKVPELLEDAGEVGGQD